VDPYVALNLIELNDSLGLSTELELH
jgi:hypothetical protein